MVNFWNTNNLYKLVELRHSIEWNDKFIASSSKAQQIKQLWENLAFEVGEDAISGIEAKEKYNYLLKQFKFHDAQSKISGNRNNSWRHYHALKEYFKSDPSVSPISIVDTSIIIDHGMEALIKNNESGNSIITDCTIKNSSDIIYNSSQENEIFQRINKLEECIFDIKDLINILIKKKKEANED